MSDHSSSRQATLTIPFSLRGHNGTVSVFYDVNTDPLHWGFSLFDLTFDAALVHGFPVLKAEIDYPGSGYHGVMGWIQVVTVTEAKGSKWASVDVPGMLSETDSPFAAFGYLPIMFDAPWPNPPRTDERWVAHTFLAAIPGVARSRRVKAILGIKWGYDLREMKSQPLALEILSQSDWQRSVKVLENRYPDWQFDPHLEST